MSVEGSGGVLREHGDTLPMRLQCGSSTISPSFCVSAFIVTLYHQLIFALKTGESLLDGIPTFQFLWQAVSTVDERHCSPAKCPRHLQGGDSVLSTHQAIGLLPA